MLDTFSRGHKKLCSYWSSLDLCVNHLMYYLRPNAVISPHGRIISHGRTSAERAETAGDYYGTWACLAWLTSVPWTRTGGVALWWQLRAWGMLIFLIRITPGRTLARSHVFISSRMQQGVRSGDFLFMVLLYSMLQHFEEIPRSTVQRKGKVQCNVLLVQAFFYPILSSA